MAGSFEWLPFLERYRVPYVERGPNVGRNEVNVRCPFCPDPSEHMGMNLITGYWHCWKCDVGGFSPVKLIVALTQLTYGEAKELAGSPNRAVKSADALRERLRSVTAPEAKTELAKVECKFPRIKRSTGEQKAFYQYLYKRGFQNPIELAAAYDLRCAVYGAFGGRVIFPITLRRRLLGWTGRSIRKAGKPKYKLFPGGDDTIGPHVIYNYDGAREAASDCRTLVVVEGPLDALKVDFYGRRHGLSSVALLGLALTKPKQTLVGELAAMYDRMVLAMDPGEDRRVLRMSRQLRVLDPYVCRRLPRGASDPGELSADDVADFAAALKKL